MLRSIRTIHKLQMHRLARNFTSKPPPPPPQSNKSTKFSNFHKSLYLSAVFGGYLIGVNQGYFLDLRELPDLLQRIYNKTLGNKDAPLILSSNTDDDVPLIHRNAIVTDTVFLDISIGDDESVPSRRVTIGLYHDVTPKTCRNFETLCLKQDILTVKELKNPKHRLLGTKQTYIGSTFHRIIPNFMIQGGDWTKHDGTGGRSIYGSKFRDEHEGLDLKHIGAGTLSMANAGPNTNSSQFFITLKATPHLNGRHAVFGKVTAGMDVVRDIEKCGSRNGKPNKTVRITNSGLVSRSSHSNRDLSLRSSKWFTNRMNEMQRMKTNNSEEKTIVNMKEHDEDVMFLEIKLKERIEKEKKQRKDVKETLRQKLGKR